MNNIDPTHHPLLTRIATGAQWIGKDHFPSCIEWADEHERWLRFVDEAGELNRYFQRLRGPKERRDEAFAELAVIFFLAERCGLPPTEWEPVGAGNKRGEVLVRLPGKGSMFVEVKSPGWEAEIANAEGQGSPRLKMPKYIDGESRAIGPWKSVREAIAKACPKVPDSIPTLLVINDDLMVSLTFVQINVDIALYCEKGKGTHKSGYLAEEGSFVGSRYERLGGLGVFQVSLGGNGIEYKFSLCDNPNALKTTAIPQSIFTGFPRNNKT